MQSKLDLLIKRGKVSHNDLVGCQLVNPDAFSYLFCFDEIKFDELSRYLKIPRITAYRRFVTSRQNVISRKLSEASRLQQKYSSYHISPNSVFSSEDEYIEFLHWRDKERSDYAFEMSDAEAATELDISKRQIQRLKKRGLLVSGTKRGTTLRASVKINTELAECRNNVSTMKQNNDRNKN